LSGFFLLNKKKKIPCGFFCDSLFFFLFVIWSFVVLLEIYMVLKLLTFSFFVFVYLFVVFVLKKFHSIQRSCNSVLCKKGQAVAIPVLFLEYNYYVTKSLQVSNVSHAGRFILSYLILPMP